MGNIAGGQVAAFDQAAANQLNNRLAFSQFGVGTQLQGAQQALQFSGPRLLLAPTPNTGATLYPTFEP